MALHFHNGPIYLGDAIWANEIFVANGRVISHEDFLASSEQDSINLQGNCLLPAFRDGHAHPLFAGKEISTLDVSSCKTLDEIGQNLLKFRQDYPTLNWISGGAYDRSLVTGQSHFFLDKYISDVPVVLHADDHHTIWVNAKALEVAGLHAAALPNLRTGSIDIDGEGNPTGFLREFEATQLVQQFAPKDSLDQRLNHLIAAEKLLLQAGIVEVQDAWIDEGMAEVFIAASAKLQLDYKLLLRADPLEPERVFNYFNTVEEAVKNTRNLKIQGIKFFIDGVFGSATALVSSPYLSTSKFGDCNWEFESLQIAISQAHQLGLQVHLHAIGDAGIAFALKAIDQAEPGPLPAVIAHAELTSAALLQEAKRLNVTLCMQPFWAQENSMLLSCVQHIGHPRVKQLYAMKDMLANGINLAFGSDWPVSSYKPIEGIAVAVYRRSNSMMNQHNPDQAISLDQAIDCYTNGVSRMLGNSTSGKLTVGQQFDAVLIEGDLREKNLDELFSTEVLSVYKSGTKLLPHN